MTRFNPLRIILAAMLAMPAFAGVTVNNPSNGATVSSPTNYAATATTTTCSKGVASMGVYVDNKLEYVVDKTTLNTNMTMSAGSHHTVVEEWDYCGGATYTAVDVNVTAQTGVVVTLPAPGATLASPVSYAATSSTTTCSKGVASMGVYINNQLTYVSQGASLNKSLDFSPGSYHTVVEEWDFCGGASYTPVDITVSSDGGGSGGKEFTNLQGTGGWVAYGEYPPGYGICTNCGPGVTWSMKQHQSSPAMSGNATQFSVGGTHPYADVLFTNSLIGTNSTQGMPDSNHTIVPNLHYFTYDLYFYGTNVGLSQVLEFDINQYFDGMGFIYGHQCEIAGGHQWDIWDNVNKHWNHTGIACNPVSNGWNHVTLKVHRTSDNQLSYDSITLNGTTTNVNKIYPHYNCGNWYGLGVNYQMDGNSSQTPYSIDVDEFSLTYE